MTSQPQGFAGLGPGDASKITDVVSAVWDHKDEVGTAVAFVRDHGDELVALMSKLPELMGSASNALSEAATDTRATAQFLTGDGGDNGVKHLAQVAADALEVCQKELTDVRSMLAEAAGALASVPLIGAAATKITDGVTHFDSVGTQLAAVAQSLRSIGDLVDQAGGGLARTADKLEGGGKALSSFGTGA